MNAPMQSMILKLSHLSSQLDIQCNLILDYVVSINQLENQVKNKDHLKYIHYIEKATTQLKEKLAEVDTLLAQGNIGTDINDFLHKVRHDLYNPLNAIQGFTELSIEYIKTSSHKQLLSLLHDVLSCTEKIMPLIKDMKQDEDKPSNQSIQADPGLP